MTTRRRKNFWLTLLGVLVCFDALQQVQTAIQYEHIGGVVFGALDFIVGILVLPSSK